MALFCRCGGLRVYCIICVCPRPVIFDDVLNTILYFGYQSIRQFCYHILNLITIVTGVLKKKKKNNDSHLFYSFLIILCFLGHSYY